jgi:hypothetical protein
MDYTDLIHGMAYWTTDCVAYSIRGTAPGSIGSTG